MAGAKIDGGESIEISGPPECMQMTITNFAGGGIKYFSGIQIFQEKVDRGSRGPNKSFQHPD